jgi:signal transduction histidine kinase
VRWASDNPLARAVARVPLPIRAKQLLGSAAVAVLLVLVAVLGLVALGQSNSRGTELRRLQQKAVYEQLLLTDANQLKQAIVQRLRGPDNPVIGGRIRKWVLWAYAGRMPLEANQLCLDAGFPPLGRAPFVPGACPGFAPKSQVHLPLTLHAVAPALSRTLATFGGPVRDGFGNQVPLLFAPFDSTVDLVPALFARANKWVGALVVKLTALTRETQARADALVAADRRSYNHSHAVLLGAGAASLILALLLGLLLSDSLLLPIRRTQRQLATIAAGDFSGRLTVPNRDEIGALAADVNRMSDELQRLYQELESASRHKSDFLAAMSHELRTPLNTIIGFSEMLQEQMFGELNERQVAYIDQVLQASEHLLALINDVLDLAKVEAGKMELELSEVAILDVLRSAVSMYSEQASRAGVELSLKAEPKEITIRADGRRVRQIVFNLVSNAVKFTPAAGRVEVSARLDDDRVEIAVADSGPGIAANELEAIFEEFTQATGSKQAEGTGLGLPLSRKLVELHGGRLWVDSTSGTGATFRFTLPVSSFPAASQAVASTAERRS